MITRRTLLASAAAFAQQRRPNVLFIIADDLNSDVGCYGAAVRTPNIDRLAARGVRFDRAYCQYPLCNPSRSSFLSGLRPDSTGVTNQQTVLRREKPNIELLPDFFKRNGYFTAAAGKIFHHGKPNEAGFDAWMPAESVSEEEKAARVRRYSNAEGNRTPDWAPINGPESETGDHVAAQALIGWMGKQTAAGKPFCLIAGFQKPHLPWSVPKRYFDLYPKIDLPSEPAMSGIPKAALITELGASRPPASRAEAVAAYRAATSYMDAQVGLLLGELDRLKQRDNTIIAMIGDNGFHLGDHQLWSKHTLFERATRVPMIFAGPGIAKGVCTRTTELLDIYPTLAALTGLSAPKHLEGASLVPLLRNPATPWDRPARSVAVRNGFSGRSARNERYRYVEWNGGESGVELYDHSNDPGEYRNLAGDPAHRATIQMMKALV